MRVLRIEEPTDERLAPYFNLKSGQSSPDSFIVESRRLVERLLESSFVCRSILTTEKRLNQIEALVGAEIPVYVATQSLIESVVGFDLHRGCLAHAAAPSTELTDHLESGAPGLTVLLEGLADPANVGAILRNAAAFGVELVIVDPKGAMPFTRKAARASAGQLFRVPIAVCDPERALLALRSHDSSIRVIAATGHADAPELRSLKPASRNVLMIGNEGTGLSDKLRAGADTTGRIALSTGVDSLNAAAASAVALYALQA